MKKTHLIFGTLVILAFLLTGQYMDKYFNHLVGMPDGPRLLYRTRHIFILMAGLLNLGIGAYFNYRTETWRRVLQLIGSLLIVAASFLFLIAFFYEPNLANLRTPLSHWGTYIIATGVVLHVISGSFIGPATPPSVPPGSPLTRESNRPPIEHAETLQN